MVCRGLLGPFLAFDEADGVYDLELVEAAAEKVWPVV
jgi:hypothetical protein